MTALNKTLLFFVAILFLAFTNLDKKACKIYKKQLSVIEASVQHKAGIKVNKIMDAINFFEGITSIKSESNGDFIGRYKPTLNDYNRWLTWYNQNKDKLYWDSSKRKIILRN